MLTRILGHADDIQELVRFLVFTESLHQLVEIVTQDGSETDYTLSAR